MHIRNSVRFYLDIISNPKTVANRQLAIYIQMKIVLEFSISLHINCNKIEF